MIHTGARARKTFMWNANERNLSWKQKDGKKENTMQLWASNHVQAV